MPRDRFMCNAIVSSLHPFSSVLPVYSTFDFIYDHYFSDGDFSFYTFVPSDLKIRKPSKSYPVLSLVLFYNPIGHSFVGLCFKRLLGLNPYKMKSDLHEVTFLYKWFHTKTHCVTEAKGTSKMAYFKTNEVEII